MGLGLGGRLARLFERLGLAGLQCGACLLPKLARNLGDRLGFLLSRWTRRAESIPILTAPTKSIHAST